MTTTKLLNAAVIVSALGYFVDVFDLLLFGVVRVKSLTAMGLSGQALTDAGISLQNWQMGGMLIGGILWGILGDKLGRVRVLYFSIALYSIANILNGFASGYTDYSLYRLIAGIGLAGELGAGITLVSEVLPKEKRGLGTMLSRPRSVLRRVNRTWVPSGLTWGSPTRSRARRSRTEKGCSPTGAMGCSRI